MPGPPPPHTPALPVPVRRRLRGRRAAARRAEPAVPGYRGLRRRGEGGRPSQGDRSRRGPGPSPVPPIGPCVRGKEAAGQAGEDRTAVSNRLLGDSPGTAPGKPRTFSSFSSLLDSSSSACIPGRRRESPRWSHTLSLDGPSRRHGGFRVGPGSEGCRDFGSAGPAGSPGAGGGAPRDAAVAAAARRLPGPGAEASPQPPPRETLSRNARRGILPSSFKTSN